MCTLWGKDNPLARENETYAHEAVWCEPLLGTPNITIESNLLLKEFERIQVHCLPEPLGIDFL